MLSEATIAQSAAVLALNFASPELFGACVECGERQPTNALRLKLINAKQRKRMRMLSVAFIMGAFEVFKV
jgi:hypothetical protein